ncbi:MAG: hypothetical protein RLZZ444_438 [Pseudomonadota bacterium]|jgi:biopolymer transport protein ExbB/TolQ
MESLSLSPIGLFLQAGPVVKVVMAILFAASVWCWIVILLSAISLTRLGRAISRSGMGAEDARLAPVFHAATSMALPENPSSDEAIALARRSMRRAANRLLTASQRRLADLAVIASVAPFIGLFGTVWGIMTAFAGIAEAKDVGLAVVAPGIAEALAATAYGLAAAIPASVGYTRLGVAFNLRAQELGDMIEDRAIAFGRQITSTGALAR